MEIILVRHTTPNIAKGICYGQADIGVTSTFIEELQPILKNVPLNDKNTVYYSSPLQRCAILAEKLSDTIMYDNRLKELNFGDWELQPWDTIDKRPLDIWMNNFVTESTKNGESYIDLHKRTTTFLEEIKQLNHEKIVIITHAGVIRSLYAYIHNSPLEKSFDLKVAYGQVIKIKL